MLASSRPCVLSVDSKHSQNSLEVRNTGVPRIQLGQCMSGGPGGSDVLQQIFKAPR